MKNKWFQNNFYIIQLVWRISPGRVLMDFFVSAFKYANWVFYTVFFVKYVMNAIETGKEFSSIAAFIIMSGLLVGIGSMLEQWYLAEYSIKTDAILYEKVNRMLFEKATEVDLECYENTEFYNKYTLAMQDIGTRIRSVLSATSGIIAGSVATIIVMASMYSINKFVVLFVAFPLIGNFIFGKIGNQYKFKRNQESVAYERRMNYVNRSIYLADYAKEIRMTNIFNVLSKIYDEGFLGKIEKIKKYERQTTWLGIWQNIFTFLLIFQGVMFYSLYLTMVTHTISLSAFAVLTSAMVCASWILILLSGDIVQMVENGMYVDNLRKFLNYIPNINENQNGETVSTEFESIQLTDVSFTYHGQDKETLSHINLTIHKGEKIAIVGHNGAGKSTLIKLLMRLYDTTQGAVLYNNRNVKEYHLKQYRSLYTTAFQDYQVFAMSVVENVLMRKPESKEDYEHAKKALIMSGVYKKIESLPKGMDTILTKEFEKDGAVLSGGELQKVAVARAFAKEYEVAIFDEPSSALDPVAEYQLYDNIMKGCKDKTVIFISHRLSTAVLADTIYLFEKGKIVEQGNHEELMELGGKYADMFCRQAHSYVDYCDEEVFMHGV